MSYKKYSLKILAVTSLMLPTLVSDIPHPHYPEQAYN